MTKMHTFASIRLPRGGVGVGEGGGEREAALVHFQVKAIAATRGSTCLPEAASELTEMAPFAYSLCSVALRLGNTMPAQDC